MTMSKKSLHPRSSEISVLGESNTASLAAAKAKVSELLAQDRQKLLMKLPFTGSLVMRLDLVPEISWKELLAQFVSSCTGGSRPVFRYIDGHPELDPNRTC